jgi:hypothetical protein
VRGKTDSKSVACGGMTNAGNRGPRQCLRSRPLTRRHSSTLLAVLFNLIQTAVLL